MPDPDGFDENPQAPLDVVDDVDDEIDERIWGPQKPLSAEEQATYDEWFLRQLVKAGTSLTSPTSVTHAHEDVMEMMSQILEARIARALPRDD